MGFFKEYRDVQQLLKQKQPVVIYAESRFYYQYYQQLINDLLKENIPVTYITSDQSDPLLKSAPDKMNVIYVKWMLAHLFSRIKASVMIMTMPDLGHFLYKRSPDTGTYIYLFHAAVSTHQQYRKNAFENYDAIFCTGSYQVEELKKEETLFNLPPKKLLPFGYPLLDQLQQRENKSGTKPVILLAPSWFEGCIFDTCLDELLSVLQSLPYRIILRPHPEYVKRNRKKFQSIRQLIRNNPQMEIDETPDLLQRLSQTDILITDRSGIALEFALGCRRPVIFIETALKETNKDWRKWGMEPIENAIRNHIGVLVQPKDLSIIPSMIEKMSQSKESFSEKMDTLKQLHFYNSPAAYQEGVKYILDKLNTQYPISNIY